MIIYARNGFAKITANHLTGIQDKVNNATANLT